MIFNTSAKQSEAVIQIIQSSKPMTVPRQRTALVKTRPSTYKRGKTCIQHIYLTRILDNSRTNTERAWFFFIFFRASSLVILLKSCEICRSVLPTRSSKYAPALTIFKMKIFAFFECLVFCLRARIIKDLSLKSGFTRRTSMVFLY